MISLITITAREDARLTTMATSLIAAHAEAGQPPIEWIIVDAGIWHGYPRAICEPQVIKHLPFPIVHVPPKPSRWHGPFKDPVLGSRELPDTNGARNTGLVHARYPWVGLLDDCSVVTLNFFKAVINCPVFPAGLSLWWERGNIHEDWAPRGDGKHPERTNATNGFRGSAVFYATEALVKINGWDEIFSGERSGNDLEAAVRLERAGLPLYVNFKAGVREHPHVPIFDPASYHTEKNDALLDQVINDSTWIQTRGTTLNIAEERAKLHGKGGA